MAFTETVIIKQLEEAHERLAERTAQVERVNEALRQEISDLKRTEEERARFFTLSLDMLSVSGLDAYFKQLNPAWEATLGFTPEELQAKPFLEFVHPEDREATISAVQKVGAGSDAIAFENRYRCKDGSYKWLMWNTTMSPEPYMFYSVTHDITARKQAEDTLQRQARVLEHMAEGVLMARSDGIIFLTNSAWDQMFGYARGTLIGQHVSILNDPPEAAQQVAEAIIESLQAHGIWEGEVRNRKQDGSAFVSFARVSVLAIEGQTYWVTVQQDITERKQTETQLERQTQELVHANIELTHSNKELDDFAYIASHDLKEPLRGIHNYAMFLLEDYGTAFDDEGRAKLETLPRLARRMETLIDSLLHFSRVGRVDLAIGETDLEQVVAEVCESLAISLKEAGIEIRLATPLPTIRCDNARVGEIFRNLITNAMKYNDKPQKWIEIGVGAADDGRAHGPSTGGTEPPALAPQVFYVRDNGIGIREKHHEAVFRIFKRLHGRDKYQGGTGAGLTIVKKIVERHAGRIWIDSTPGEGSTFYFTLEREGKNRNASYDI